MDISNWIFAKADTIKAGSLYIDSLIIYRLSELEKSICPLFDKVVKDHFDGTMKEAQRYLDEVLKQEGIVVFKI